ncbi:MAG: hypothetical protein JO152_02705 [Mycobacteriaceae bacterium]|nr:hypothetical protein [Mycobacteriaceae bacterium]
MASRSKDGAAERLRRRRDCLPGYRSPASIVFAALAAQIRSHGIDVQDSVTVMFDCRRYLPSASRVYGNFVSGVDLAVGDPGEPSQLDAAITAAAACGRPLAAALLSAYRFRRRYRSGHGYVEATCVPRRPRARLVFSHVGDVFANSPMWSGEPSERFYDAINESKDPEAIVFTVTRRGTGIDITASFHDNVFSRDVVQAALDCVVQQPERHLTRTIGDQ